jgi:hypothetical protein
LVELAICARNINGDLGSVACGYALHLSDTECYTR